MKTKSIFKLSILAAAFLCAPLLTLASVALALVTPSGVALDVLNPASITWNGKEVMAMNEAIFEDVFINPEMSALHTIVPNIVAKQQIAYLGLLTMVGRSGSGCSPTSDTATATLTEKFWNPSPVTFRLEECYTTYNASFFVWSQNKGIKRSELTNTDVFNFIQERAATALSEAQLRIAWFGDTDATNYNGSPAGLITNGVNTNLVDAIDGFFKQIYAIVAADASKKAASITKNAGGTYSLQAFDSTDTTNKVATGYFRSVLTEADLRLRGKAEKMFIVTQSVYDQYLEELEQFGAIESAFKLQTDGTNQLTYRGIPVVPFAFLDRMIDTIQDNGTKWYQPHRIILTTKQNLQVGVESEEALKELDPHYDKVTKKNYIDTEWLMDAKVIQNYMI